MRVLSVAVVALMMSVPAFAGETVTPTTRIWRTPDVSRVPADVRERRHFEFNISVDPNRDRYRDDTADRTQRPERRARPAPAPYVHSRNWR
jgi:hypothetical protein